jgi:hypothetical protein
MFNALLGGAFGMNAGYFGQQQAMYQQQLQNMYPLVSLGGCKHTKPECLICKEEAEKLEKQRTYKKEVYRLRCSEWMKKVGRKNHG